ncbi:hypothetical protein [Klebsiella sp. BIGb0407]|uniref:hypothetical protein n=1 Tax=Klebsiella sp. BIGb0407 TaxID=2940603 RepID=UPI002167A32C|nr:hypothetical protein [Klebsiella sp. BIGb0407]MCS3430446.1 hypothetical protein [Klebsiella sp. BIGb0407]
MSYDEARSGFSYSSYSYCRHVIGNLKNDPQYVMPEGSDQTFAYEAWEGAYSEPVEDLMLELFTLIFMAGRGSQKTVNYHKEKISKILSINNLSNMLENVTEDDKTDILSDLQLLELIDIS